MTKKYEIELSVLEKLDQEIKYFYSIDEVMAAKSLENFRKWFVREFV